MTHNLGCPPRLQSAVTLRLFRQSRCILLLALLLAGPSAAPTEDHVLYIHHLPSESHVSVWRIGSEGSSKRLSLKLDAEQSGALGRGSTLPLPSPDGRWLAFTRENDVWLLDPDTGESRRITHVGAPADDHYLAVFVYLTAWSPDSSRILYHVAAGLAEDAEGEGPVLKERPREYGYFIFDRAEETQLPLELHGQFQAWLPDGDFLLLPEETRPLVQPLLRFNPLTKTLAAVGSLLGWYGQISVSADGRWALAGVGQQAEGRLTTQLIRIDLATGETSPVTPVGEWADYQWPRFSPSARFIAYVRQHEMDTDSWPRQSLVVDDRSVYFCAGFPKRLDFAWINDRSLVASCGDEIVILNAANGKVKGKPHH